MSELPEPDLVEQQPLVAASGEEEEFDALAAFEAAEAEQAAEAARNAELNNDAPDQPDNLAPPGADAEAEDDQMQWRDIFGDEDEGPSAPTGAGAIALREGQPEVSYAALFGEVASDDDDDVLAQEPLAAASQDFPALTFEHLFGEEEAQRVEPPRQAEELYLNMAPQLTEIHIPPMPRLPEDQKQKLYYVKIPQALHFEERPYDRNALQRELERRGGQVITPDNVVRWRHWEQDQVQSNARIVQWDNGDMHLFVGREVYDISKHPLIQDNNYLFSRGIDGTHFFQHKFSTAMRIRTTLSKKSSARDLVSKKIKGAFIKKVKGRELRMGLTDTVGRLPPAQQKELENLQKKRSRLMAAAGGIMGVEDTAGDEEDQERVERLHTIKRGKAVINVRRGRPADDADVGL